MEGRCDVVGVALLSVDKGGKSSSKLIGFDVPAEGGGLAFAIFLTALFKKGERPVFGDENGMEYYRQGFKDPVFVPSRL